MENSTCQWPECGATIVNGNRRGRPRRWCDDHRRAAKRERDRKYPADSTTKKCSIDGCDRFVRARGLCQSHYMRVRHATIPEDRQIRNGNPAIRAASLRIKSNFRRSIITAPDAEQIDIVVLGDRDGWVCGICGESVDRMRQVPDRMAATIDHVLPISRGGRHRWDNVQLSHFACNMAKGDAVA